MEGVAVAPVPEDLAVDAGVAPDSAVPPLEHEERGALAHHEAVALHVEWP